MANHIRAYEINYAGQTFHSQIEARWAVFFDVLGVHWTPQPKRLRLPQVPRGTKASKARPFDEIPLYTPDFYLPDIGTWVEVKAAEDQLDLEEGRARQLAFRTAWYTRSPMLILGDLYQCADAPSQTADWAWLEISPHRWTFADKAGPVGRDTRRLRAFEKDGVQGRRVTFHRYPTDQQMTSAERSIGSYVNRAWTQTYETPIITGETHAVRKAYRAARDSFMGMTSRPAAGVEPGRMRV
ncbi:hypothetical protein GCM10010371_57020 [Streptomyces subrutilus]|uniref:Uncharacterized protein n=1 Tax=Streptomyces subrutilus TaxID=36818 RepID=A0A918R7D2_9ACTN|nr:hypothetical protein [Streptomyces subrutilus]GGZ89734.1 hypothetical protein GCM10010371_57020 [Streptomyces subrutilus]